MIIFLIISVFFSKNRTKKFFDEAEKYTKGIFLSRERNIERICESHHDLDYYPMQHFISDSNWDARLVIDKSALETSKTLPKLKLTGLIIDETGTVKKGEEIKYSFTNVNLVQYTEKAIAYMQAQRFFVEHCIKESKYVNPQMAGMATPGGIEYYGFEFFYERKITLLR